jgi:hypothetical protein
MENSNKQKYERNSIAIDLNSTIVILFQYQHKLEQPFNSINQETWGNKPTKKKKKPELHYCSNTTMQENTLSKQLK